MASCPACGKDSDGARCPHCGAAAEIPANEHGSTRVYGSPELRANETLVLGSNVPLSIPRQNRVAPPPEAAPAPAPKPEPLAKERRPEKKARPLPRVPRPRKSEALGERRRLRVPTPLTKPKKRGVDRKAVLGISLGAGAFLLIALLALWLRPKPPGIEGWVTFDAQGKPSVEFRCADCSADSEISLRGNTTRLPGRLPFEDAPSLGQHPLSIELKSPGKTRQTLSVTVRVPFVVSGDLSGLGKPKPTLSVVIETTPEAGVIVNGKTLGGNREGPRRYEIDVSGDVTGQETSVRTLERKLPYAVSVPGLPPIRGELVVSTDVVPLTIEAPGESITVEGASFMLAGATQANGSISVDGRAITVDPSGRFAQLMNVSSVGNTTVIVRASAPGRAPRLAPVRVRRVSDLKAEAASFAAKASRTYAAVSENAEKKLGWSVALSGKVTESRPQGFASSLLLSVDPPCNAEPCLVRLLVGEKTRFSPGDHISAYGYLNRPTRDREGRMLPEVRVEFLRGDE